MTPRSKTVYFRLGNKTVPVKIISYGQKTDWVFINLHDDETSSVDAATQLLQATGGILIKLENQQHRNITFRLAKRAYSFDPNRIFTRKGIINTVLKHGRYSKPAVDEIEKLGKRILQLVPATATCIIALHNNREGQYSAASYRAGAYKTTDARKVYLNPQQDTDDLFFTTDDVLYEALANKGYNTILQDNQNCVDDGSLSVYYGKKKVRYVNCETERGKTEKYLQMITDLSNVLDTIKK